MKSAGQRIKDEFKKLMQRSADRKKERKRRNEESSKQQLNDKFKELVQRSADQKKMEEEYAEQYPLSYSLDQHVMKASPFATHLQSLEPFVLLFQVAAILDSDINLEEILLPVLDVSESVHSTRSQFEEDERIKQATKNLISLTGSIIGWVSASSIPNVGISLIFLVDGLFSEKKIKTILLDTSIKTSIYQVREALEVGSDQNFHELMLNSARSELETARSVIQHSPDREFDEFLIDLFQGFCASHIRGGNEYAKIRYQRCASVLRQHHDSISEFLHSVSPYDSQESRKLSELEKCLSRVISKLTLLEGSFEA